MKSVHDLIVALWLVLLIVWAVGYLHAGRTLFTGFWRRSIALRVVIIALVLIALRFHVFRHDLWSLRPWIVNRNAAAGIIGVVLCALGVGLAIWARLILGRNWGMPMTQRNHPELVTAGPYAVIRHPIYSGILIAVLGSAIGMSIVWIVWLIVLTPWFIYSAWHEEQYMAGQFPDQYPAYRKRTRMLLPFVL